MLPLVIGLGAVGYIGHKLWKKKGLTKVRKRIYDELMMSSKEPAEYRRLADVFEKEGLSEQAAMLRKRAALREAPDTVKEQRRAAFKKAMNSTDPVAIEAVAKAHEEVGALGAAANLRKQAEAVRAVKGA